MNSFIKQSIHEIYYPEIFHHTRKGEGYFEGWYFKLEDEKGENVFAIIPGISYSKGNTHSFIQFFDNSRKRMEYCKFPESDFRADFNKFDLTIGDNRFNLNEISLSMNINGMQISAEIKIRTVTPIKKSFINPGAMGPFSYFRFMECNHHILSMNSKISGFIEIDGEKTNLDNGNCYIEKDYGRSFPSKYIWLQSNRFIDMEASVICSIAEIPFGKIKFTGLLCFLNINGKEHVFSTYNFSSFKIEKISSAETNVTIRSFGKKLQIYAKKNIGINLKSPSNGEMKSHINESLSGEMEIIFENRGKTIKLTGQNCGIEIEMQEAV